MMDALALLRPEIRALPPAFSEPRRFPTDVRLQANESVFPFEENAALATYPAACPEDAEAALADLYDVPADRVLATRGSDEGIDLLVRAFCTAGRDAIAIFPPTFGMYAHAARVQGARVEERPLRPSDFVLQPDLLRDLPASTKVAFLCSPNNPTGTLIPRELLLDFARRMAQRCIVVVDEAYVEFASVPSLVRETADIPNLVVLRTLSKAHGLAGARVGAIVAHAELVEALRRIRPPYALTSAAIAAVTTIASPARKVHLHESVTRIKHERARVFEALRASPAVAEVWSSEANFHLVRLRGAAHVLERFGRAGILVRQFTTPGLEDCVRITVGSPEQNDAMLTCLEAS